MLDRFRMTDPMTAYTVAGYSVMAAGEEPNLSETVRLAELALNGAPKDWNLLGTLGAALYGRGGSRKLCTVWRRESRKGKA